MHSSFKLRTWDKNIFLSVPKFFLTKKVTELLFVNSNTFEHKFVHKSVDFVDKHLAEATQGHFGFHKKRSCFDKYRSTSMFKAYETKSSKPILFLTTSKRNTFFLTPKENYTQEKLTEF